MLTLGILVLLLACTRRANGCQGYVFKVTQITSCDRSSIITADSASWAVINENCSTKGHVCLSIKREIARAQVNMEVIERVFGFPITVYSTKFDSCNAPSEWTFLIAILGLSGTCPFPAGNTCTDINKIVNIPFSKSALALLKNDFSIRLNANEGQVKLTCVEIYLHKSSARTRLSLLSEYLNSTNIIPSSKIRDGMGMKNQDMSNTGMKSMTPEVPPAARISRWNPVL